MTNHEQELPRDLEKLHEELSAIRIAERSSFGPELEAELGDASLTLLSVRRRAARVRRIAAAAMVVGVLAVGSVPQVRGALTQLLDTVRSVQVAEGAAPEPELAAVERVIVPASRFVPLEEADQPTPATEATVWTNAGIDAIRPTFTHPKLKNPEEAERIVAMHYPPRLQEQRVGGDVRVMIWVDEEGLPRHLQVAEGSGEAVLDRAAVRATARLRFEPARRQGDPVGSWVKFTIRFQPPAPSGVFQPRITEDADVGVSASEERRADTAGARPRR